ncbi:HesA/MoeB/ThiF family protein [Algibacter pectinivorans]|uniref:Molybdopterin-synthase adenylyltransferase n=1 Tax=Algibacter pectinivorans TaxID=870482 RepID=A0A1I1MNG1_9FLAO|nr:HesA/MoeB/ThiF family protein [Algibacter pectinivorans]SFC86636.1 adenylyltransferase and sulfurtransferase [Algibacter pectinivorans]
MLSKEEQVQYSRHILLNEIGVKGQLKLKEAKVLVIGAGGLGCPILQYLTAAGVGTLGIIDNDVVDQTNLQRQILYTVDDVGKPKVEVAVKRLARLNPFVQFQIFNENLTIKNALSLFKAFDVIVDGSDNFQTRYLCNDTAVIVNKPLVYGSIFKFEGQVSVFNFNDSGTYRCLYPTPPKPDTSPNCSDIGVMGVLPGIIGGLQANEVIKIICGLKGVLANKLLVFDVLSMRQIILSFSKTDESKILKLEEDYNVFCGIESVDQDILMEDLLKNTSNYNLLDVREISEREQHHIGGLHIPLGQLQERYHEISTNKPLVVYCKSGMRSKKAILFLRDVLLNTTLINLRNGLPVKFLIKN